MKAKQIRPHKRLLNDVARCDGVLETGGVLRKECSVCLRKTAPRDLEWAVYMAPPPIVNNKCETFINHV